MRHLIFMRGRYLVCIYIYILFVSRTVKKYILLHFAQLTSCLFSCVVLLYVGCEGESGIPQQTEEKKRWTKIKKRVANSVADLHLARSDIRQRALELEAIMSVGVVLDAIFGDWMASSQRRRCRTINYNLLLRLKMHKRIASHHGELSLGAACRVRNTQTEVTQVLLIVSRLYRERRLVCWMCVCVWSCVH